MPETKYTVPPQTSQSQLAEHMMFIVERMAIDECMTPHLIPGWDTMMRYYVRSWDDDCIVTAKEIRDRIFVTAIDKAESVTDAVAIKARLETRYIELLNMTPKDIVKLKEQPTMSR